MADLWLCRHTKRVKQHQLAEMVGLDQPIISMIETGRREPTDEQKRAIERALQCREGEINWMQKQFLAQHSQRLCDGICKPMSALVFVDFINNLEEIADHLTNVAQASSRGFAFSEIDQSEIGAVKSI